MISVNRLGRLGPLSPLNPFSRLSRLSLLSLFGRSSLFPVMLRTRDGGFVLFLSVPLRGSIEGTDRFPIRKYAIFRKFKEIGGIARRRTFVRRTSGSAD